MGTRSELWGAFEALANSGDASAISAVRCGGAKQHLLIKGNYGEPILLLATEPRKTPRAPVRLKHVSVGFELLFEVTDTASGEVTSGTYCKFICEPTSVSLHPYFVEVLAATASIHGTTLSQLDADEAVDAMLELFRQLEGPPKTTVVGLWGELLIIHAAKNTADFINAWHIAGTDTYDFAFSDARMEVKATECSMREHDFALAQVRGGRTGDTIASLLLSRSAAGISVLGLANAIAQRVPPVQQQKLWTLVLAELGQDAEAADEQTFDLKGALDSLRLIPATRIPAPQINGDDNAFVSNVRFRANIAMVCETTVDKANALLRR
ncbi:MAG TPA: PD-(D/E)XK motif protein [Rhodoferax sp.]